MDDVRIIPLEDALDLRQSVAYWSKSLTPASSQFLNCRNGDVATDTSRQVAHDELNLEPLLRPYNLAIRLIRIWLAVQSDSLMRHPLI